LTSVLGALALGQVPASAAVGITVTFVQNGGSNPSLTTSQAAQTTGSLDLTLFSNLNPAFSNPGHTFDFWSTQPGGGGTQYTDGASYSFDNDITLYAEWIGPNHTVTFYENSDASDQTESYQVSNAPTPLTLIQNLTPTFSRSNYSFLDWTTSADGTGATYSNGAILSFVSAVSLFAQWTPNQETLSFSSNTGSGTVAPLAAAYGSSVSLPNGSSLSKTDYTFTGWNTLPDGSGTKYVPGASIRVLNGETFYAMWSRDTYKVLFDVPGFKDKVAPISVPAGDSIRLRSSSGLSKAGYSFSGWFTEPKRGHFAGKSDASYTPLASITLYARWTANSLIKMEFLDNGGVGHIRARSVHSGLAVVIPNGADLHRKGFTFRGWASSPRAPGPTVHVGSKLVLTHNTELYALWRRALPASTPQVLLGSIGIFRPNSSVLTPAMRHYVALLAIGINQHNRTMVLIYGYATSLDSAKGSALLSLQRALAVEKQLNIDLSGLNDVGVIVHATGEGRLTDSALASFRKVEVFAN
jgi:uncharacterized repeat protein (TIGR02543 family)